MEYIVTLVGCLLTEIMSFNPSWTTGNLKDWQGIYKTINTAELHYSYGSVFKANKTIDTYLKSDIERIRKGSRT